MIFGRGGEGGESCGGMQGFCLFVVDFCACLLLLFF